MWAVDTWATRQTTAPTFNRRTAQQQNWNVGYVCVWAKYSQLIVALSLSILLFTYFRYLQSTKSSPKDHQLDWPHISDVHKQCHYHSEVINTLDRVFQESSININITPRQTFNTANCMKYASAIDVIITHKHNQHCCSHVLSICNQHNYYPKTTSTLLNTCIQLS